jgi:cyclophilin family peptidyl-prolyl cis-trans isomerase
MQKLVQRFQVVKCMAAITLAAMMVLLPRVDAQTVGSTVKLQTALGDIEVLLYDSDAPRTVANFLAYVNSSAYNGSFIHRSVPGFVIQGGGYRWNTATSNASAITERGAIANEFAANRSNLRGTIAMARAGGQPNSATSQWFINLSDSNRFLDTVDGGFTVFGRVSEAGMSVVDAIARLPISNLGGAFNEIPLIGTLGNTVQRSNLVMVETAALAAGTPVNYQGLWWNDKESGWGLSINQKGASLFAAAYTYDSTGKPAWVVMSCTVNAAACSGQLYRVTGGSAPTVAWQGTNPPELVGTGTLSFSDARNARFQFTIGGVSATKNITQLIGVAAGAQPATDYSDIWWNDKESGWGISISQQFSNLVSAWYTYDAQRNPVWYIVSECRLSGRTCTGRLLRVAGGSPLTATWAPQLANTDVGPITLEFSAAGDTATMRYTIDGVAGTRNITRVPL